MMHLPAQLAARLAQIDYDRQMALVAVAPAGEIVGVARLDADPDGVEAEFALLVRSDWHGRQLGRRLLRRLADYASDRGHQRLWGLVLRENANMLALTAALGFQRESGPDGLTVKVVLPLREGLTAEPGPSSND